MEIQRGYIKDGNLGVVKNLNENEFKHLEKDITTKNYNYFKNLREHKQLRIIYEVFNDRSTGSGMKEAIQASEHYSDFIVWTALHCVAKSIHVFTEHLNRQKKDFLIEQTLIASYKCLIFKCDELEYITFKEGINTNKGIGTLKEIYDYYTTVGAK